MPTRQDFVDFIKNELHEKPHDAYTAIGPDILDKWIKGEIFGIEDRWFAIYQQEGDTNRLKNLILFFLNLSSVGYENDKQLLLGDQYRTYLEIAKDVVKQSRNQLADMQSKLNSTNDPVWKKIWPEQIAIQRKTIYAQEANVTAWQKTLSLAIANGYAR